MSRKGDCWDNAPMESFFPTLKTERVHHRVYATRNQPRRDLFHYIEGFEQSPSPALSPGLHQPQPPPSAEPPNPVHYFGGRSVHQNGGGSPHRSLDHHHRE